MRFRPYLGFILIALALAGFAGLLGLDKGRPVSAAQSTGDYAAGGLRPALPGDGPAAQPAAPVKYPNGVVVGHSYKNDETPPLRTLKPQLNARTGRPGAERDNAPIPLAGFKDALDPVVQRAFGGPAGTGANMPAPATNWEGMSITTAGSNVAPPDTNGDVGPNHYIQTVNTAFQIWNKSGVSLYGPANLNTLWQGFGGPCETRNDGDPVVLYDQLADRWLISQFTSAAPYDECIAISSSGDPTGSWYRYAFQFSTTTVFYDYPHLGVWPDGYYMTANVFDISLPSASQYQGPAPVVFDRAKML